MADLQILAGKLDDSLNPLLVRELRQSLRSGAFQIGLSFISLACALAIICGVLYQYTNSHDMDSMKAGQGVFSFILSMLWLIACVGIPVGAANRFRAERSGGEFELFAITGISPHKMIVGKLQSALAQSFLLTSVAAPFMMACYLLRGISALDIFLSIVALFTYSSCLTQAAILLGSLNLSKLMQALANIGFVMGLIYSNILVYASFMIKGGGSLLSSYEGMLMAFLCIIWAPLYIMALCYLSSVSLLELPNRNRGFWLKLGILAAVAFIPLLGFLALDDKEYRQALFYMSLSIPVSMGALFVPMPYTNAPSAVRRNWTGRRFAFLLKPLLYPGRGSAFVWLSLCSFLVLAWEYFLNGCEADGACPLGLMLAVISFWGLVGSLGRFAFKSIPTPVLSLCGIIAPSLISILLLFASMKDAAELLFPFSIPIYVDENKLWGLARTVSIVWGSLMLVYGFVSHGVQLRHEAKETASKLA